MRRNIEIVRRALVLCSIVVAAGIARAQEPDPSAGKSLDSQVAAAAGAGTKDEPEKKSAEAPDPGAPTVGASLDRTEAHVGDRLTLTVSAVAREGESQNIHLARLNLGKFDVLDQSETERDLGGGPGSRKLSKRFVIQIAAYELGELEIPPITVEYQNAAGARKEVTTAAIPVFITRVVDDPKADLQPLARPRELMVEDKRWLQGAIAAGAAIVLLIVVLVMRGIARRRRRRPKVIAPVEVRPPHEIALERLREIRAKDHFELDNYRPFHFAVAEVVRGYLGARFNFDSLELTTTELVDQLGRLARPIEAPPAVVVAAPPSGSSAAATPPPAPLPIAPPRLDLRQLTAITAFLEECDLVKFAKAPSSDERARALLDTAEEIVRATTAELPAQRAQPVTAGATNG